MKNQPNGYRASLDYAREVTTVPGVACPAWCGSDHAGEILCSSVGVVHVGHVGFARRGRTHVTLCWIERIPAPRVAVPQVSLSPIGDPKTTTFPAERAEAYATGLDDEELAALVRRAGQLVGGSSLPAVSAPQPDAALPACPPWCAGDHSAGAVYVPHRRPLFHEVGDDGDTDVLVDVLWPQRRDDIPSAAPRITVDLHSDAETSVLELSPGQADLLASALSRLAAALAEGATLLAESPGTIRAAGEGAR